MTNYTQRGLSHAETKQLPVRVTPEQLDALDREARRQGRNRTEIVREALSIYLDKRNRRE